jgi:hypothetical protein
LLADNKSTDMIVDTNARERADLVNNVAPTGLNAVASVVSYVRRRKEPAGTGKREVDVKGVAV